jgi:NAD(P)-dependent dehydrogenase (short-subunit alcohol dehydrogenase family)
VDTWELDVLVNNAAMRNNASLADATPEEWQAVVSVNLMGTDTIVGPRWRPCAMAVGAAS